MREEWIAEMAERPEHAEWLKATGLTLVPKVKVKAKAATVGVREPVSRRVPTQLERRNTKTAIVKVAKSIPARLREMTGYMDSATTMEILKLKKTAFYAQVKSGAIPATRWESDFRIDPLVLADKLEGVTT